MAQVGEALRAEVTVVRRSGSRVSFRTACSLANSGVLLVDGSAVALIKPQQ